MAYNNVDQCSNQKAAIGYVDVCKTMYVCVQ